MRFSFQKKLTVTADQLKDISFVLFFCSTVVTGAVSILLRPFGLAAYSTAIKLVIIYLPLLVTLFATPEKIKVDFLVILAVLVCFFCISYFIHPEYGEWYGLSSYGAWDYVFRPDNGLYAYLFLRLIREPERIWKNLHIISWILLPYHGYKLIGALRVGYWTQSSVDGSVGHYAYNLTFGYSVLLLTLIFLYRAIKQHSLSDWIGAGISIVMIALGGSRGPFLCLGIFVLLMVLTSEKKLSRSGIVFTAFATFFSILAFVYYKALVKLFLAFISAMGLSSRTLTMILQGGIADDNGRQRIWNAAIQMIKDNPWGHGAMGSRLVIRNLIDVGHPHQVFLEILIDFGIIIGGAIIVIMLIASFRMLFRTEDKSWQGLFIVFFCRACQLLLSGTFWHVSAIWACLGIGVNYITSKRKARNAWLIQEHQMQ